MNVMKQLPTLFARGNNGKVLEWSVEVQGNKYRFITGAQGFKQVTSEWSVAEPKNVGRTNATTAEEQAFSEAKSHWEKKIKRNGYWENIGDIDKTTFVEPMLAKNLKDRIDKIDWNEGVLVQNKFNGFRCVATFDGENVVLKSRKGELYVSVPHINIDLKKFFETYPDAILDGELFNNDLRQNLNEISKLVRKTKNITDEDLLRSEKLVRFFVYDGYNMTSDLGPEVGYIIRKQWIDDVLPKFSKFYHPVKTLIAHSINEVDSIFGEYVKDCQEGVIVRIPNSSYENKRSSSLLKYKPIDDAEATIIDIKEGTGNWSGTGKIITLQWEGKSFDATFKGTYEEGVEFLKNKKKWIGKEVKFIYNSLTGLGIPNYARVDINNCTPEK